MVSAITNFTVELKRTVQASPRAPAQACDGMRPKLARGPSAWGRRGWPQSSLERRVVLPWLGHAGGCDRGNPIEQRRDGVVWHHGRQDHHNLLLVALLG
jgi:hypothetical protein